MKFLGIEPVATLFVCFACLLAFYLSIHLSICSNRVNKVPFMNCLSKTLATAWIRTTVSTGLPQALSLCVFLNVSNFIYFCLFSFAIVCFQHNLYRISFL